MQILLQEHKNISERLAKSIIKKASTKSDSEEEKEVEKNINRYKEDLKSLNSEINHENGIRIESKPKSRQAQTNETRSAAQAPQLEVKKEPLIQTPVKIEATKEYKPWDIFKQI
jgi:hypothetical protein